MGETTIRIGTSGWHYKHWLGGFYPADLPPSEMLAWYANHFNTVEINNTFYRLPTESALRQWRQTAPQGFIFSVKGSRFITHMKRLRDPHATVKNFFSRVDLLGDRLGPILFQLPPRWNVNLERLEEFLDALPRKHRYVFEFRDPTWSVQPVYKLLRRYEAALCIHDWRGVSWPLEFTADSTYVRFHGPTGNYSGNYPKSLLEIWARQIREWQTSLDLIWVYFNNDIGGHAIANARTLGELLSANRVSGRRVA